MANNLVYKVSFETEDSCAYFFINGIDDILKCDFFNRPFKDAKTDKEITFKKSILEQLSKPKKQPQQNIEFNRYKQDCRKKASELAFAVVSKTISNPTADDIIKEADKYYNWLISIPE